MILTDSSANCTELSMISQKLSAPRNCKPWYLGILIRKAPWSLGCALFSYQGNGGPAGPATSMNHRK